MATVRMPSSLQAQMTRSAISPRLAMSNFRNIGFNARPSACSAEPHGEERLAVFDRLAIGDKGLYHFSGRVCFYLIHQLHGLDDAEHLPVLNLIANLDESSGAGRRRLVKRAHDGRLYDMQRLLLGDGIGGRSRRSGRHRVY